MESTVITLIYIALILSLMLNIYQWAVNEALSSEIQALRLYMLRTAKRMKYAVTRKKTK